jgi:hypothetical protein
VGEAARKQKQAAEAGQPLDHGLGWCEVELRLVVFVVVDVVVVVKWCSADEALRYYCLHAAVKGPEGCTIMRSEWIK